MATKTAPQKLSVYEKLCIIDPASEPTGALTVLVEKFYQFVLTDPEIQHFFEGMDMEHQKAHLLMFIRVAIGDPNGKYSGRSLADAHARPRAGGLKAEHFDRVAMHLVEAMKSLHLPQDIIDDVVSVVGPLKNNVVEGKEES